ncbi:HutD/Ves family protein [Paracoccus marinaquae]|uniref:HutD family protein n=1 Tax=Paracoccus marinaquae TaxID=2841926 RepID=A0ABS6AE47_9RHOB|nr:HutD family protein [Paracoccus marinaquae]MBU3028788.1 HutD family protein [Paracoccus marinaquae]
MPWKNGGGTTHEIATFPPGAGMEDFDFRVSLAEVAAGGPFSRFEGVDRTQCLMQGAGMMLTLHGQGHALDAAHPMIRFPGEAEVTARLTTGPIPDSNIMTRRARLHHRVVTLEVAGRPRPALPATWAVICRQGRISVSGQVLGPKDCMFPGSDEAQIDGEGAVLIAQCESV